ncbi:hypothetical protein MMC32_007424 [Xylographa parallela]|nr:hypothetical protein [Xylographa parallela]
MGRAHKEPKLPVKQLLILSICRFAEPVALTSVFPYLPEMIESFNVPKNQIAKWAGITSAVFSLAQCMTAIAWGRASDRFGRKPIILLGLSCTMMASLLFGFSRSLAWAITARAFAGASNGTVGIIRTTVAEMVPQKILQPRAFSVMPLVWTIGSIFGPIIGGALAKPATRYPGIFGTEGFFTEFPFALPNMMASALMVIGVSTGLLFLKETLETKRHQRDYGRVLGKLLTRMFKTKKEKSTWRSGDEQSSSLLKHARMGSWDSTAGAQEDDNEGSQTTGKTANVATLSYRDVFSPQSNINLLTYTLLAMHSVTYDQLLPVFMHLSSQLDRTTSPDVQLPFKFAGGMGLDSGRIGLLFTLYGVFGMIVQFLVFPPVARRFGILPCLKACTIAFPLVYLLTPFTVLLPTPLTQQIAIFCVMLLKSCAGIFAFPCTTILLTNSARSLRLLGTLNGVATSLSAIGRALGPTIGGGVFTLGIDLGYVIIPWFTIAGLAALGNVPVWWLIEMDGFGGAEDSDSDEENDEEDLPREGGTTESGARSSAVQVMDLDGITEEPDDIEDDFAVEDDPLVIRRDMLSDASSNSNQLYPRHAGVERRMSSPLGQRESVGPGGSRRLSNGLGQSMDGFGSGGTAYQ